VSSKAARFWVSFLTWMAPFWILVFSSFSPPAFNLITPFAGLLLGDFGFQVLILQIGFIFQLCNFGSSASLVLNMLLILLMYHGL